MSCLKSPTEAPRQGQKTNRCYGKIVEIVKLWPVIEEPKLAQALQRNLKQPVNCTNIADVLDRCGALASYSHTIPGSAYPTSLEELREACPKHNEGLHCLRQHVKCLKPLTKRAILSFIESRRKHVKKLCGDLRGQAARDFTEAFACIKRHKRQKFVDSEITAIKRIDAILGDQVKDFKERFQRSCCSINHYRARTVDDMQPECGQPHLVAAVEVAIESVVGEAIEFACPDAKSGICSSMKELNLTSASANKTLTRAGTDLMIVLTAPDEPVSRNGASNSQR